MNAHRTTARIVGVLFIIGTVAGVLSVLFTRSILGDPDQLTKVSANENQLVMGALCVLIMGFALAMVPVVLFPIFKKQNEPLALGYVVFRGALETVCYVLMVIGWLLLITLGQEYAKAGTPDASYFQTLGTLSLEAVDWIEHITKIVFGLGAVMFYYLWYQSKLIPRWLSGWGLIAIILYIAAGLFALFGTVWDILLAPLAVNEMVLALWLIVKGFNSSAVDSLFAKTDVDG